MPQLHYQFQTAQKNEKSDRLFLFIHGLFGDMNNLGAIARAFADDYAILRVDLRNHGRSFHADEMNYRLMAEDVKQLLIQLKLPPAIVVGHSMGGKTAMMLAEIAPECVEKLVIIDIAPIAYQGNRHQAIFAGLQAVKNAQPTNRQDARVAMSPFITDEGVQQFMLKAFEPQSPDYFRFNLVGLQRNYVHLMDWQAVQVSKPTLFIKGALSDYIQAKDSETILAQFPNASSFIVANTDHWVHAEKPDTVVRAIKRFLANGGGV